MNPSPPPVLSAVVASATPFRIGLLCVYFGLFDQAMPPEFRQERTAFAHHMRDWLEQFGSVVFPGLVDSDQTGRQAAQVFEQESVDVIVFVPTMAAPPSYGWESIRDLDGVPVVAVAAQELEQIPSDYHTEEATRRSLTVGLVMFTNVLFRQNRPFVTLVGKAGAEELRQELADSLAAARGVAAVRGSRLLALGEPIPGYDDVEAPAAGLAELGVEVVAVDAQEVGSTFAAVDQQKVEELAGQIRQRGDTRSVDDPTLHRSARLALALDQLCAHYDAAGGAVNCHGQTLRQNPQVGITACLGVARCSEMGKPFSCTGDLPIAIALLLGKQVAGSALYCELYQLDFPGNWLLVANGGEGDPTIRPPSADLRLLPEDHYRGIHGPGTAVAFELPVGPATLTSMTYINHTTSWGLTVAQGQIIGSQHHAMEGPNGMFRFDDYPVAQGYSRWCQAGATHHAALLAGHHRRVLETAAQMLGVSFLPV